MKYKSKYYNPEYNKQYCSEHKTQRNFNRNVWYKALRLEVLDYYSNGKLCCFRCGISDVDVLCLDHIHGDGYKDKNKAGLFYRLRKAGYPEGYQVLCANCNLKKAKQLGELERRS